MQLFVSALEMIGTVAFAASGALTAMRKKMDLLGVIVLGVVTAVGGGMIRDILLGISPPLAFRNPLAVIVAIAVSVILFIPWARHHLMHNQRLFATVLLVMAGRFQRHGHLEGTGFFARAQHISSGLCRCDDRRRRRRSA